MNPAEAWLTEIEQQQVKLIADDFTYTQIATRVGRSVNAVHSTATRIRTRLGVHSAAAIVHWAWQYGYLGDRRELLAKINQQNAELTRLNAELSSRPQLTAEITQLRGQMQRQAEDRSVLLNQIENLRIMYRAAVLQKPGGDAA